MCVSCCVTEVTRKPGVIYTLMLLPAGRNEGPGKTAGEDPTHTTPPALPASGKLIESLRNLEGS